MENTGKALIGGIGMLIMLAALSSVAQAQAPPPPPQTQDYVCPIDGLRFATYEELYQHFITEHPATPIDIIWD